MNNGHAGTEATGPEPWSGRPIGGDFLDLMSEVELLACLFARYYYLRKQQQEDKIDTKADQLRYWIPALSH